MKKFTKKLTILMFAALFGTAGLFAFDLDLNPADGSIPVAEMFACNNALGYHVGIPTGLEYVHWTKGRIGFGLGAGAITSYDFASGVKPSGMFAHDLTASFYFKFFQKVSKKNIGYRGYFYVDVGSFGDETSIFESIFASTGYTLELFLNPHFSIPMSLGFIVTEDTIFPMPGAGFRINL